MSARNLTDAEKAARLRVVAQCVREGLNRQAAAARLGLANGSLGDFLYLYVGSSALPADPEVLEAAARDIERGRPRAATAREAAGTDEARIAELRSRAEAARAAHERRWLDAEQRKYGLSRRGRPLSEMPL